MIGIKGYSEVPLRHKNHKDISYSFKESYESYRSRVRGNFLDIEVFMWKTILLADSLESHAYFPWSDTRIANYISGVPKNRLYKFGKNKLILRNFLEKYFGINFDKIGKRIFSKSGFN